MKIIGNMLRYFDALPPYEKLLWAVSAGIFGGHVLGEIGKRQVLKRLDKLRADMEEIDKEIRTSSGRNNRP